MLDDESNQMVDNKLNAIFRAQKTHGGHSVPTSDGKAIRCDGSTEQDRTPTADCFDSGFEGTLGVYCSVHN